MKNENSPLPPPVLSPRIAILIHLWWENQWLLTFGGWGCHEAFWTLLETMDSSPRYVQCKLLLTNSCGSPEPEKKTKTRFGPLDHLIHIPMRDESSIRQLAGLLVVGLSFPLPFCRPGPVWKLPFLRGVCVCVCVLISVSIFIFIQNKQISPTFHLT